MGIVLLLGVIFIIAPLVLQMFIGLQSSPALPLPEITYGEFPFRLEYEIDGKRYIIEDTLIAEFDRSVAGNATTRARRMWNTTLESGDERRFILKEMTNVTINFRPGLAEYYMGDLHGGDMIVQNPLISYQPRIVVRTVDANGRINMDSMRVEDAHKVLAEHGI